MKTTAKRAGASEAQFTITTGEGDTVVLEPGRGLMWDPSESAKSMTYKQALAYVKKLRTGGFKDWRSNRIETAR